MAEIRCPMCGKMNSDELDVCQFCEARLKPLFISSEDEELIRPGESLTPDDDDPGLEGSVPDWMKGLRGSEPESGQDQPAGEDDEAAFPEFAFDDSLSSEDDLDFIFQEEMEAEPAAEPEAEQAEAEAAAAEEEEEETTDWLAGLASQVESQEEDVPDWLASLRPETGAGEGQQPEPASGEEQTPDWLAGLRSEEPAADLEDEPGSDQESVPAFDLEEQPGSEEVPAFSSSEDISDWLAEFAEETSQAEEQPVEPALPAEGMPDWMAEFGEEQKSAPVEGFAGAEAASAWEFEPSVEPGETTEDETTPAFDASALETGEEIPDWLRETGATPEQESPLFAEELPDWLKESGDQPVSPEEPAEAEETEEPLFTGEVPDWLAGMQESVQETPAEETPSTPAFAFEPGEDTPDWLEALPAISESGQEPEGFEQAFRLEEEASGLPEAESAGEPGEELFPAELPDWLAEMQGTAASAEEGEPAPAADITPADLPSWVQAMRPVESVIGETAAQMEEVDQRAEKTGPLAGLRSLLPLAPGLEGVRKPQAYSVKLQVNDSQRRHSALLEAMVAAESEPRSVPRALKPLSQVLSRWGIALLLLLVVLMPVLVNSQAVPGTSLRPPEMLETFNLVGQLPASAPVLLVFDYEPGLSGEMDTAAAPLVDHLLIRSVKVTIVSTSPTGPILAERFLDTTQAGHNYQPGQQYVNLGYLAGGQSGITGFASSPQQSIRRTLGGDEAWQTPPLEGVERFSDFDMVVVITDNADTGRAWIEQAGPFLVGTPMVMVASAQAEPMLRPYFDSRQIKGMVTGLAGGASYEGQLGRPGLGRKYWDAYSFGFLVAELLIFVGVVWSIYIFFKNRRAQRQEEA